MRLLFLFNVTLFLLGACSSIQEQRSGFSEEIPEDFNFVLNYGYEARDIINTYENTYTKNMVSNDDETVEMILSEDDTQKIYNQMKEADILNSAKKTTKTQCADPYEENKLKVTMNGEVYEREWITSYCDKKYDNKLKKFVEFVHDEIIMNKVEYKELPNPAGGYD